jgi:hypothetical protein
MSAKSCRSKFPPERVDVLLRPKNLWGVEPSWQNKVERLFRTRLHVFLQR